MEHISEVLLSLNKTQPGNMMESNSNSELTLEENIKRSKINILKKIDRVPIIFSGANLSQFDNIPELKKNESALITGKCGTGKTHLAVALLKQIIISMLEEIIINSLKHDFWKFENFNNLAINLKSCYSIGSSMTEMLEPFKKYHILVLDDIGTSKPTDSAIDGLYYIINSRYEEGLTTICTANLDLGEISSMYGDRIASRLSSFRQIKLSGNDRRLGRWA